MSLSWRKIINVEKKVLLRTHWDSSSRTVAIVSMRLRFTVGTRCLDTSQCDWSCVWIQMCASLFYSYVTSNKVKDRWSEPCGEGTQGAEEKENMFLPPASLLALITFHREVHIFAWTSSVGLVMCTAVQHLFLLLRIYACGMGSCPKMPKINHVHED